MSRKIKIPENLSICGIGSTEPSNFDEYRKRAIIVTDKFYKDVERGNILVCLQNDKHHKPMWYQKGQCYEIVECSDLTKNKKRISFWGKDQRRLITFETGSPMSARFCLYDLYNIYLRKNKLEKLRNAQKD